MIHRSLLLKLFRRLTELFVLAETCCLDYAVTFLCVTEPPEERMEQALFSPPLSKQRLEYAVQHIKKTCATTLVILIPPSYVFCFIVIALSPLFSSLYAVSLCYRLTLAVDLEVYWTLYWITQLLWKKLLVLTYHKRVLAEQQRSGSLPSFYYFFPFCLFASHWS